MSSQYIMSVDPSSKELQLATINVHDFHATFIFANKVSLETLTKDFLRGIDIKQKHEKAFGLVTPTKVVIEKAQSSPQMGARSAFNYGFGAASINFIIRTVFPGVPIQFAAPNSWKAGVGLIKQPKSASPRKVKSLIAEKKLTPTSPFYSNHDLSLKSYGLDHHLADAVLMGYFVGVTLGEE